VQAGHVTAGARVYSKNACVYQ